MINKKQKKSEKALTKQYKISTDKLMSYYNGAIILALTVILCYFLNWVYVYNTGYGIEVKASGFSFIIATLSGKFYSTDKIYGDLAIPFYYYAKESCEILGILSLVSLILIIVTVLILIIIKITKFQMITFISILLSLCSSILLVACFVSALEMKNGQILSVYCGGNPKCYIGSLAILASVVSFIGLITQLKAFLKFLSIYSTYKKKR